MARKASDASPALLMGSPLSSNRGAYAAPASACRPSPNLDFLFFPVHADSILHLRVHPDRVLRLVLGICRPGLPPLAGGQFSIFTLVPISTSIATVPAPHEHTFRSDHDVQRALNLDVGAPGLKPPVLKPFQ